MHDNKKWYTASLCITSKAISASDISVLLGIEPSESYEQGVAINPKKEDSALRDESLWILDSGLDEDVQFDIQLQKLLDIVEQKIVLFKKIEADCQVDLFCSFASENGQGSLVVDSQLMQRLTMLPINLVIDLYPPVIEEE